MFCPKCQSLMFPRNGKMVCGNAACGFNRDINDGDNNVTKVTNPSKIKPMETLVLEQITSTLPKTSADCPKCGHGEAFWVMRQTRAADEPTTRIYRCAKCSHTWREY
jgi:DNA-directed RNA polymerase subunit M